MTDRVSLRATDAGVCPIAWTGADLDQTPVFHITTADGRRFGVPPATAADMLDWPTSSTPQRIDQVQAWIRFFDEHPA